MKIIKPLFYVLFLLFNINSTNAQSAMNSSTEASFSADYMKEIDAAKDKILALAEAIPENKYSWRPSDGVRSVSEVFVHVASANFFLPTFAGAKLPSGLSRDAEKTVTKKEDVIKLVKESYESLKNFISNLDPKTLNDEIEFFGTKGSKRYLLLILLDHNHEHLGQSIAYARMNGIVPPWSRKQN